jgi:hypothetical protein
MTFLPSEHFWVKASQVFPRIKTGLYFGGIARSDEPCKRPLQSGWGTRWKCVGDASRATTKHTPGAPEHFPRLRSTDS